MAQCRKCNNEKAHPKSLFGPECWREIIRSEKHDNKTRWVVMPKLTKEKK